MHFSHLYIERRAEDQPLTSAVLQRFPKATRIGIDDYKNVFNRPRQSFAAQKRSMNLILAVKKDQWLYDGSSFSPSFGHRHFYYNTLLLNCVYNCDYCYLQGMYPSANLVLFVNEQDFFSAVDERLQHHPVYLCISYDTDLLAVENVFQLCRRWITFASERPDLTVELRTKSANFAAISDLPPHPGVVLAWTITPEPVATAYESGTPRTARRLQSVAEALHAGWRVRICVDPVLWIENARERYETLVGQLAGTVALDKIHDFSIGTFRMNKDYLAAIRRFRKDSPVMHYPFVMNDNSVAYSAEHRQELTGWVLQALEAHGAPREKIIVFE